MNINYEKLKELPDEEKIKVLKELAERHKRDGKPYFPAMATALGGSVIAVANLYNRLVEGKHVGRTKQEKDEPSTAESPKAQKEKKTKQKSSSEPVKEQQVEQSLSVQEQKETPAVQETQEENLSPNELQKTQAYINKYELSVNAVFDGEEAADRIIGIANSFFKTAKYSIELKIKEL